MYILMKQNNPIAILWVKNNLIYRKITLNKKEMPLLNLNLWIRNREIPKTRDYFDKFKQSSWCLPFLDFRNMFFQYYGLNLSDQYWIQKTDKKNAFKIFICRKNHLIQWEDINYFDNYFDNGFGKQFFDISNFLEEQNFSYYTPDCTTNGNTIKYWTIIDNERYLVKGPNRINNDNIKNQLFLSEKCNELNQIRKKQGKINIDFVEYKSFDKNIICKCFCNKNEEYIPLSYLINNFSEIDKIIKKFNIKDGNEFLDFINELKEKYGIIVNFDNIGLIKNIDTNKYRFAPIHGNIKIND